MNPHFILILVKNIKRMQKNNRTPNLIEALIPIIILIALLSLNVIIYKDSATYGPNQIALIIGSSCCFINWF